MGYLWLGVTLDATHHWMDATPPQEYQRCWLAGTWIPGAPMLQVWALQLQPDLSVSFLNGLYRWMKAQFIPLGILFGSWGKRVG